MIEFEFPIRQNLKRAWTLFLKHPWYFVVLSAVLFLLSFVSGRHGHGPLELLVILLSLFLAYVYLSSVLAAVDEKDELLTFDALKRHLPTFRQFLTLIGIALVMAVIVLVGFIALIIPGIYLMTKLMFSNFAFIDRQGGVKQSLKFSWQLVKGHVFWTAILCLAVSIAIIAVGGILAGVGIIITYPIAMLFLGLLYRALTNFQPKAEVVSQPNELPEAEEVK